MALGILCPITLLLAPTHACTKGLQTRNSIASVILVQLLMILAIERYQVHLEMLDRAVTVATTPEGAQSALLHLKGMHVTVLMKVFGPAVVTQ